MALPLISRSIASLTVVTTLVSCALFTAQAATGFVAAASADSPLDTAIVKLSATHWVVERSFVERLLGNEAELMRAARVVPHEEGGRVVGLKLFGIRRNSLLGKLGLQNGDVLRSINGMSPRAALKAFEKLRDATTLNVDITRRDRCMSLIYRIVSPPPHARGLSHDPSRRDGPR